MSGNTNRILFFKRQMQFCSHRFIILMRHTRCILSVLQLVQSHLHGCAYISVLFSDFKENKKTKRASQTSLNLCLFKHLHMPSGAFSEPIVCYQQMPCNHTHSLHGDPETGPKVHMSCLPVGHIKQIPL